ncbi:protein LATERAL ROOT PRIMORDIUM 1-like isoform X1 [Nymphaea colorata]|nr:protein LATERAL ROOT PRIMORDIUM 1-like isoform X1 [Nymphaea colorata]
MGYGFPELGIRGFHPLTDAGGAGAGVVGGAVPLYDQHNQLHFRDVLVVGSATFHHASADSVASLQPHVPALPLRDDEQRRSVSGAGGWEIRKPEVGSEEIAAAEGGRARQETLGRVGGCTCQDCGNQAKKDCAYRRCRTCCKARGFDCETHIKSTWVPASKRKERHLVEAALGAAAAAVGSPIAGEEQLQGVGKGSKRARAGTLALSHSSASANSSDISSAQQGLDLSFRSGLPGHVRAQAVFKCVRVTPMDDGEDEFAYQAVVKIGGHVFKGVLYDQGRETSELQPEFSELQLSGRSGNVNSASLVLEHVNAYDGASGSGFIGGGNSYAAGNEVS